MFQIINNIYTKHNSEWINNLEDSEIQPIVINKWLMFNTRILPYTRYLDRYVFSLKPKHWLLLAWSIIPKQKPPFVKYIKKLEKDDDIYENIWEKVRNILELSNNDFESSKKYLLIEFNKNKPKWFKLLGMNKEMFDKHNIPYNMNEGEVKGNKSGLELFGL